LVTEPAVSEQAMTIGKLMSGGQTGVDRAALDFAVVTGLSYGGWCPRGGWAEDLPTPPGLLQPYPRLVETPDAAPAQRTRWNVRDADATLLVVPSSRAPGAQGSPGTELTRRACIDLHRPLATIAIDDADPWGAVHDLVGSLPDGYALNVAGPRESESPGIYESCLRLLQGLGSRLTGG
jgi:hypothetical protein